MKPIESLLHSFVTGSPPFDDVWQRRVVADLGTVKAPFVSLDDLKHLEKLSGGADNT